MLTPQQAHEKGSGPLKKTVETTKEKAKSGKSFEGMTLPPITIASLT
ncbi:MAG: hypothetical protein RIC19_14260 [Phaeodactylibacter sp.]